MHNDAMRPTFIGIDLGTTFLKGAVIDLDEMRPGHIERIPFPPFIAGLPVSHREVDPDAIVNAVRDLVRRLLPHAPGCAGLVMCTQMHGLVLTDEQGAPLSNAITWQDQRTEEAHPSGGGSYYEVMSRLISPADRLELGNDLWASRPLSFLYWLNEHHALPEHKGVTPASLPDFVLANLCHTRPGVEPTNAAAYGALNVRTGNWHHELIERLSLGYLQWPHIRQMGAVVGIYEVDGVKLSCYTPIGDHQCAVLGTLLHPDELSINVSTGSQVGMLSRQPETSLDYQTRPYFEGSFLKAVIHIPAGRALNALIRLLSELAESQGMRIPDPWSYIAQVTSVLEKTDLHVDLSFFPSSCGAVGAITNAREDTLDVANIFMGAFQNMAENYMACARRIWPAEAWRQIVFSGGLVQKLDPLKRVILGQFDCPYRFPHTTEDTLMGLTILAQHFSGRAMSVSQATQMIEEAL
jgi:sugar (pentulose or hexulose) kinase